MKEIQNNRNWIIWLILFVLSAYLVYVLRSVLLPFVVGIVIGYLLDPCASKFEKMGLNRTFATLAVMFLAIIFIVPILLLIFGFIQEECSRFAESFPLYAERIMHKIEPVLADMQVKFPDVSSEKIKEYISENMIGGIKIVGKIMSGVVSNGFAFINLLSLLLITPVVTFYMLRDWKRFIGKVDSLLPRKSKSSIRRQAKEIDRAMAGFIRGQLSVCLLLGAYYSIGLYLVGLDMGVFVGFLAGIISFIPYVGSISGFIISILLAVAQFNSPAGIIAVVIVFVTGQFLEGNFLTPKLVGDSVGLHPVWIMFALLAGGALLGFLGLMIAVPVAAVIAVLLRHAIENYKKSSLYLGN